MKRNHLNFASSVTRLSATCSLLLVGLLVAKPSQAARLYYDLDLTTGQATSDLPPYIQLLSPIVDSNGDNALEALLKINLNDPAIHNPFNIAEFQIKYTSVPDGITSVNIGDSRTNNGAAGDGATQTNDAELNIGQTQDGNARNLYIYGNDNSSQLRETIDNFVPGKGSIVNFMVKDGFLSWNNHKGSSGSLISPFLYALNGQYDYEQDKYGIGTFNYDIFAAFNRVIDGPYRHGSGVGKVTVCLRSSGDRNCFGSTPEPSSTLGLGLLSVALLSLRSKFNRKLNKS